MYTHCYPGNRGEIKHCREALEKRHSMAISRQYSVARKLVWLDDSIELWVDMPGVKGSDVEVMHKDGVLTITGTVSTKAYEKLALVYTEYNVGNYS